MESTIKLYREDMGPSERGLWQAGAAFSDVEGWVGSPGKSHYFKQVGPEPNNNQYFVFCLETVRQPAQYVGTGVMWCL